jgi:hypothetical protein
VAEGKIEAIAAEIQSAAAEWYPGKGDAKAVRLVARTPRRNHHVHELVIEFEQDQERVAVKLYRGGRRGAAEARRVAEAETEHLRAMWEVAQACGLEGIPRPLGDFSARGAVVSEKLVGVPLQSMILKAALLPGYAGRGLLQRAAASSGAWLRAMQDATRREVSPLDAGMLLREVEQLCERCRSEGLDADSIDKIVAATRATLARAQTPMPNAAVLHEFTPLHIVVMEEGVGFTEFAQLEERGSVYTDPASFLAAVEVLEKYPFCDHTIITEIEERFLEAYGASELERAMLGMFKMKFLLAMFAAGRVGRESAARKKVMWANVMKKFIQTVADRAMPDAA